MDHQITRTLPHKGLLEHLTGLNATFQMKPALNLHTFNTEDDHDIKMKRKGGSSEVMPLVANVLYDHKFERACSILIMGFFLPLRGTPKFCNKDCSLPIF